MKKSHFFKWDLNIILLLLFVEVSDFEVNPQIFHELESNALCHLTTKLLLVYIGSYSLKT